MPKDHPLAVRSSSNSTNLSRVCTQNPVGLIQSNGSACSRKMSSAGVMMVVKFPRYLRLRGVLWRLNPQVQNRGQLIHKCYRLIEEQVVLGVDKLKDFQCRLQFFHMDCAFRAEGRAVLTVY